MSTHCTRITYWGWPALCVCVCMLHMCLYICVYSIEGKEEEWTVKFQRSVCAREQSGDKGGLVVTNLQRKITPALFAESLEMKGCLQMQLPLLFRNPGFPLSKSVKKTSLVLQRTLPVSPSLGGMLGQKGPWHCTVYISHPFLVVSHKTVTNYLRLQELGVCKCIQLWVGSHTLNAKLLISNSVSDTVKKLDL